MTLVGARAELMAALVAAGVKVSTAPGVHQAPAVILYGDGIDTAHIGRGQVVARHRLTLYAGTWDGEAAGEILAALTGSVLGVLRELVGWRVDEVRADSVARIAGGDHLAVDILASRTIDL